MIAVPIIILAAIAAGGLAVAMGEAWQRLERRAHERNTR